MRSGLCIGRSWLCEHTGLDHFRGNNTHDNAYVISIGECDWFRLSCKLNGICRCIPNADKYCFEVSKEDLSILPSSLRGKQQQVETVEIEEKRGTVGADASARRDVAKTRRMAGR